MTREITYHCDRTECDTHIRSTDRPPIGGFLEVHDGDTVRDYCGWDCLMKDAATIDPPVIIPMDKDQP